MINIDPSIISTLLKPEMEEPSVLNKSLVFLSSNAPQTQTYYYSQVDAYEVICLKLFSNLCVSSAGQDAVVKFAKQILNRLLTSKLNCSQVVFYLGR